MIVSVLHFIAFYIMLWGIVPYFKTYNIKINIHNLPKFLLGLLAVCIGQYLCIKHFKSCLPSGAFLGVVLFLLQSSKISAKPFTLGSRILSFFIMVFCWPEFLAFLIFHFICMPHEKSQP